MLRRVSVRNFTRSVGRAVVDDHPLSRKYRLTKNGINGGFDVLLLIPSRSDNDVPRVHRMTSVDVSMILSLSSTSPSALLLLRRVFFIRRFSSSESTDGPDLKESAFLQTPTDGSLQRS